MFGEAMKGMFKSEMDSDESEKSMDKKKKQPESET
jgi:hypothetical protein